MGVPTIIVKQGWLRGAKLKSVSGESFISFKGIPYAAPPVGNLRFADPQPPVTWTGIRDVLNNGPKCAHVDLFAQQYIGEEDCLYLNVATKSLEGSRPVMVWIHGGAFIYGDGGDDIYGPDYLVETDIVLVTINYRIGVLGFFQLDHEVAPGNMGLKDQVAALKWVKENISQFGGNPNNITIFGESAGSASVHFLLHSPLAKGLFHKAIMQSGVLFNPWIVNPSSPDFAHRLVATLGKETTDPHEIIEYLRTIPVDKLIAAQGEILTLEEKLFFSLPFYPNVDAKSPEPFMPQLPDNVAMDGIDVPLIIGYSSDEGIMFLMGLNETNFPIYNENFDFMVAHNLSKRAPSKTSEIGKIIKEFYFKDEPISADTLKEYAKCLGDINFVIGIHKVVEIQQRKKTPTYFYRFSHASPKSVSQNIFHVPLPGAGHGDELPYIFYPNLYAEKIKVDPGSAEEIISKRMVKMWTDFAKTGNPTPQIDDLITVKWDPVTWTTKNYLEIAAETSVGINPDEEISQLSKRISKIVDSS